MFVFPKIYKHCDAFKPLVYILSHLRGQRKCSGNKLFFRNSLLNGADITYFIFKQPD